MTRYEFRLDDEPHPTYVRWLDSAGHKDGQWTTLEDIEKGECICETVGYLVLENDHSLFMAGTVGADEIRDVLQIPTCAVVERRSLLEPPDAAAAPPSSF